MTVKTDELEIPPEAAHDVAKETLRSAVAADWYETRKWMRESRGGDLTIAEVDAKMGSLTQAQFHAAMQVNMDIVLHAPEVRDRQRSIKIIADVYLRELELKLKHFEIYAAMVSGAQIPKHQQPKEEPVEVQVVAAAPPQLPPEVWTELIQERRARTRR